MSLVPVAPWPVLVVLALAALAAVWWNPTSADRPAESRGTHWRLTAAVALLAVAALRPGVPGDQAETTGANLNVYFVVDTTSSIIAEDWAGEEPRVKGVRDDIAEIARSFPGARFSVITFDQVARVRLPLTTDSTALEAALDTLLPEPSEYSHGTSVTVANERLVNLLTQARDGHPERGRVVYYLGDGEQTAPGQPAPFTIAEGLINGGAVLGYGTTDGGRMKATRSRYDSSKTYLKDPATGEDARSIMDEGMLRRIGEQLHLPFVHRESGESLAPALDTVDLAEFGTSDELEREKVRTRRELYWPLLIGVAALAAWELGAGAAGFAQTRRRRGEPS